MSSSSSGSSSGSSSAKSSSAKSSSAKATSDKATSDKATSDKTSSGSGASSASSSSSSSSSSGDSKPNSAFFSGYPSHSSVAAAPEPRKAANNLLDGSSSSSSSGGAAVKVVRVRVKKKVASRSKAASKKKTSGSSSSGSSSSSSADGYASAVSSGASGYESAQASQAGPTPFFLAKGGPSGAKGGGGKKGALALGGASQRGTPGRGGASGALSGVSGVASGVSGVSGVSLNASISSGSVVDPAAGVAPGGFRSSESVSSYSSLPADTVKVVLLACKDGDYRRVKKYIQSGFDVNTLGPVGKTAVWKAAYWGQLRVVKLLHEAGADLTIAPTGSSMRGKTPLDVARDKGHVDVVNYLKYEVVQAADISVSMMLEGTTTNTTGSATSGYDYSDSDAKKKKTADAKATTGASGKGTGGGGAADAQRLVLLQQQRDAVEAAKAADEARIEAEKARQAALDASTSSASASQAAVVTIQPYVPDRNWGEELRELVQWSTGFGEYYDRDAVEAAKEILDAHPEVVDSADGYGKTSLWHASNRGSVLMIDFLLDRNADPSLAPVVGNYVGVDCVAAALQGGHEEAARRLEERTDLRRPEPEAEPVDEASAVDAAPVIPNNELLLEAAKAGSLVDVKRLVALDDVDIDTTDGYGKTPLWHASFVGRAKIVDFLVSQGAAIWRAPWSGNYDGMSCYDIAKDQGNTAVVKIYEKNALSTGVVLEQAPELTPEQQAKKNQEDFFAAVVNSDFFAARALVDAGADFTASDNYGKTALWKAADVGDLTMVEFLASLETEDALKERLLQSPWSGYDAYKRPLDIARDRGHEAVEEVLQKLHNKLKLFEDSEAVVPPPTLPPRDIIRHRDGVVYVADASYILAYNLEAIRAPVKKHAGALGGNEAEADGGAAAGDNVDERPLEEQEEEGTASSTSSEYICDLPDDGIKVPLNAEGGAVADQAAVDAAINAEDGQAADANPAGAAGNGGKKKKGCCSCCGGGSSGGEEAEVEMETTYELIMTYEGHAAAITCMALDDTFLYTGSKDHDVLLFNTKTGEILTRFELHTDEVTCLELISGDRMITTGRDSRLVVWDRESGDVLAVADKPPGYALRDSGITALAWDEARGRAYVGFGNGTIGVYNPKAKEWEAETFEDHGDVISSLTLAKDGTRLISTSWDSNVFVWNVDARSRPEGSFLRHTLDKGRVLGCKVFTKEGTDYVYTYGTDMMVFGFLLNDTEANFSLTGWGSFGFPVWDLELHYMQEGTPAKGEMVKERPLLFVGLQTSGADYSLGMRAYDLTDPRNPDLDREWFNVMGPLNAVHVIQDRVKKAGRPAKKALVAAFSSKSADLHMYEWVPKEERTAEQLGHVQYQEDPYPAPILLHERPWPVREFVVFPDQRTAITADGGRGTVTLWNPTNGHNYNTIALPSNDESAMTKAMSICLSPNSDVLFVATAATSATNEFGGLAYKLKRNAETNNIVPGKLHLWFEGAEGGHRVRAMNTYVFFLHTDGKEHVISQYDYTDLSSGLLAPDEPEYNELYSSAMVARYSKVRLNPAVVAEHAFLLVDNKWLIYPRASVNYTITVYNALTFETERKLTLHQRPVLSLTEGSIGGKPVMVSGDSGGTAFLWDLTSFTAICKLSHGLGMVRAISEQRKVDAVAINAAAVVETKIGNTRVMVGAGKFLRNYNLDATAMSVLTMVGGGGSSTSDTGDGQTNIVTVRPDVMEGHQHPILNLKWQEETQTLFTAGRDGNVIGWNVEKNKLRYQIDQHKSSVAQLQVIGSNGLYSASNKLIRNHLFLERNCGVLPQVTFQFDVNSWTTRALGAFKQWANLFEFLLMIFLVVVDFAQLASFAFQPATEFGTDEVKEAVSFTQNLGAYEPPFYFSLIVVFIIIGVFYILFFLSEPLEAAKFKRPANKFFLILWYFITFFAKFMSRALFLMLFGTLVRTYDCTNFGADDKIFFSNENITAVVCPWAALNSSDPLPFCAVLGAVTTNATTGAHNGTTAAPELSQIYVETNFTTGSWLDESFDRVYLAANNETSSRPFITVVDDDTIRCWEGDHIIYAIISGVFLITYVPLAFRITRVGSNLNNIELLTNPFNISRDKYINEARHPFAITDRGNNYFIVVIIVKMLLTLIAILLTSRANIVAGSQIGVAVLLIAATLVFPPYFSENANRVRWSLDFGVLWTYTCGLVVAVASGAADTFLILLPTVVWAFLIIGYCCMWAIQRQKKKRAKKREDVENAALEKSLKDSGKIDAL